MKRILLIIISLCILAGCSLTNRVAMKVGDVEVKQSYIDRLVAEINTQSGGTVSEAVSKEAQQQAEAYAMLIAIGEKMKLDVKPVYDRLVADLVLQYGSLEACLEERDMTREFFDFIMYGSAYQELLINDFINNLDLDQAAVDNYFQENYLRAKHLLLLTQDKTDAEKAEAKKEIDRLFQQAKDGADFDALIAEYNEDPGTAENPDGYVFASGEMVTEFEEGVKNIEIGEYNLVETNYGYHIIKRLALDETPELYEQFKNSKIEVIAQNLLQDDYFQKNFWRAKHLLLLTQGKSSVEKAEIKNQIEDLYQQVIDGADFDALIAEYNEDPGVEGNPDGYVFTYNEMVQEFFDGVSKIEIGEFNLVETDYGYHIVKRLALDETPELYNEFKANSISKIESAKEANLNEMFKDYLHSKTQDYEIETLNYIA